MDDDIVNSLVDQLSNFSRKPSRNSASEELALSNDNLDEFILEYTGRLVKGSVDSVENMKDFIDSAPDPESAEALASLIKSAASSIDILQRVLIAREKNAASKEMTQMKIDSQQTQTDKEISARLLMSREEAIKALMQESQRDIDVEAELVED